MLQAPLAFHNFRSLVTAPGNRASRDSVPSEILQCVLPPDAHACIQSRGGNAFYDDVAVADLCSTHFDNEIEGSPADTVPNAEILLIDSCIEQGDNEPALRPFCCFTMRRSLLVIQLPLCNIDVQTLVVAHLARFAPLVLVFRTIHSGRMTAWYSAKGFCDPSAARFCDYALDCGADAVSWNRFEWIELPNSRDVSGNQERELIYLNPPNTKM
jgi:hypothetical protein